MAIGTHLQFPEGSPFSMAHRFSMGARHPLGPGLPYFEAPEGCPDVRPATTFFVLPRGRPGEQLHLWAPETGGVLVDDVVCWYHLDWNPLLIPPPPPVAQRGGGEYQGGQDSERR